MGPLVVAGLEVAGQAQPRLARCLIIVQIDLFIFNGTPQALGKDVVQGACDDGEFLWVYDAYGNLTDDGATTYTYDAAQRLTGATDGLSTTTYAYSGDGDRISQTVDSVETTYILDVATPLTMVLAETTGQDSIYYLHGLDLVAQSDGTTTDYLAYDGLGSVRQVLDDVGAPL